jgi:putative phosphoribosyl transferase
MKVPYADRHEAGQALAEKLRKYSGRPDVVVLGLPRGGVVVAYEVARALRVPLDVFVVRKLGVPGREELAMGALASGGVRVLNDEIVGAFGITDDEIEAVARRESEELRRRERAYRGDRPPLDVRKRIVLLVDDGLATGATMRAAVAALRHFAPARIVVAVPIAAPDVCEDLGREADEIVCAATPEPFFGVGAWYENFSQTTDEEVNDLLERARKELAPSADDPAFRRQGARP